MREMQVLTGRRVVVSTPAATLGGIVESATRDVVTLTECALLDGREPVPVDGFVLIPSAQVSYVQVVPE